MKRKKLLFCIFICVLFLVGCNASSDSNSNLESIKFYKFEDFDNIDLGITTIDDFIKEHSDYLQFELTGYGAYARYPSKNNEYIELWCYGPQRIITAVRLIKDDNILLERKTGD